GQIRARGETSGDRRPVPIGIEPEGVVPGTTHQPGTRDVVLAWIAFEGESEVQMRDGPGFVMQHDAVATRLRRRQEHARRDDDAHRNRLAGNRRYVTDRIETSGQHLDARPSLVARLTDQAEEIRPEHFWDLRAQLVKG